MKVKYYSILFLLKDLFASFCGVYFLGVDGAPGGETWLGLDSKALF